MCLCAAFLSSRPAHIWPWSYNPFDDARSIASINKKLRRAIHSPFIHQIRIWPTIPLKQAVDGKEGIDMNALAQLKYLHTLVSRTTFACGTTRKQRHAEPSVPPSSSDWRTDVTTSILETIR